jgi:hypothetical protein
MVVHILFERSRTMRIRVLIFVLGLMMTVGVIAGMAQTDPKMPPGPPPQRDALAQLKGALQNAGAPALTSEQESSIMGLIQQFREAHRPPQEPPQVAPQPDIQSDEIAKLEAEITAFAGSVLNILQFDSAQVTAINANLGKGGLEKLIRSLAGGPGRFGRRGGPGGGPGGPDGFGGPGGFGGPRPPMAE